MKKKIFSILMGAVLAASSVLLTACQGDGQQAEDVTVIEAPALAYDTAEGSTLNSVIATDELVVSFAGSGVSAAVTSGPVTLTEGPSSEADGVTTQTYTLTASDVGDYVVTFTVGEGESEETVEELNYTVVQAYPENPEFNRLQGYGQPNTGTTEANVHDPSVIEANGKFYTFSTDNMGPAFGYQVRESDDLIHWEYVGVAIEGHDITGAAYKAGTGALQEVYDVLVEDENWDSKKDGETWTLWAPDVTEGADGKYWLYGCWTAEFGQGHSAIFLCKADEVTGPYVYDSMILYSYDGWPMYDGGITSNPNAIDPQIYYVGDKMFMAYGSFTGGTWSIELDPETGRRADGLEGDALLPAANTPAAERYGTRLVSGTVIEGPTINHHENVAIYEGDPAEYSESAVTYEDRYYLMGSANNLATDYNMRSFHAAASEDGSLAFVCANNDANTGDRVSGSFSWRKDADTRVPNYDFFAPGHNDMITTSDGRNIIAYHNRIGFGGGAHYLFTSSYAFTSRGDLVMNPNRYAGEAVRKIVEEEITAISEGSYSYAAVTNNSYRQSFNGGYAKDDMILTADHKIQIGGQDAGTWIFYGDNYIYIDITEGELDGEYYGVVMPAYIEASRAGGLTISCLSGNGRNTLFLNENV